MKIDDPLLKYPLRGALLEKALSHNPEIDPDAVEALSMLRYSGELLTAMTNKPLEECGVSQGKFRLMMYLQLEEGRGSKPPSPSDIAENLSVTRATITGLLDGLERDGLLERRYDANDRRALTIHITAKGKKLYDELAPKLARRCARIFALLDPGEKQTLLGLLSKLVSQNFDVIDS